MNKEIRDVSILSDDTLTTVLKAAKGIQDYAKARDAAIRLAHREGFSLREIAEAAGVSHQTVANIIERTGR